MKLLNKNVLKYYIQLCSLLGLNGVL